MIFVYKLVMVACLIFFFERSETQMLWIGSQLSVEFGQYVVFEVGDRWREDSRCLDLL